MGHSFVPRLTLIASRVVSLSPDLAAEILAHSEVHFSYLVLHRDQDFKGQTVIHPACRKNLLMQGYLGQFPEAVMETESLLPWADSDLIQIMFGGELAAILEVEAMLQSKALAEKVRLTKTYYPHKNLGIIDLLDKDCSKRTAVEFLAGYYGIIPRRDIGYWRQSQRSGNAGLCRNRRGGGKLCRRTQGPGI